MSPYEFIGCVLAGLVAAALVSRHVNARVEADFARVAEINRARREDHERRCAEARERGEVCPPPPCEVVIR